MKTKKTIQYGELLGSVNIQCCTLTKQSFTDFLTLKENTKRGCPPMVIILTNGKKLLLKPESFDLLKNNNYKVIGAGKIRNQSYSVIGQLEFKDAGIISGNFWKNNNNFSRKLLSEIPAGAFTLSRFKECTPTRKPSSVSPTPFIIFKDKNKELKLEILNVINLNGNTNSISARLHKGKKYYNVIALITFVNDLCTETKIYSWKLN